MIFLEEESEYDEKMIMVYYTRLCLNSLKNKYK
jgi:hypothetical protein